jgi:hypothetical protein
LSHAIRLRDYVIKVQLRKVSLPCDDVSVPLKAGHGNDRVWKAMKPLPTLPTLFGNPFGIPTLPRPRRRD